MATTNHDFPEFSEGLLPALFHPNISRFQDARSEDPFMEAAVELCKEFASYVAFLGGIYREDQLGHTSRNDGILRGLLVRITKLLNRLIFETCERHGDVQLIYDRLIMESVTNLGYLLNADGDERFDAFVMAGMRQDKALYDLINKNVAKRGSRLPIEERMLKSLESKAKLAGVELATLGRAHWPSFEGLLNSLGLGPLYLGYRTSSTSIHGTWPDLVRDHLKSGSKFEPNFDWIEPRPQSILATIIVSCRVVEKYASYLGERVEEIFAPRLRDLEQRTWDVDRAHEAWLSNPGDEES